MQYTGFVQLSKNLKDKNDEQIVLVSTNRFVDGSLDSRRTAESDELVLCLNDYMCGRNI